MLIAGEASGDRLAAELVTSLCEEWRRCPGAGDVPQSHSREGGGPKFFGAGGGQLRAAGVEIIEDMSQRGVIGVSAVLTRVFDFARLMNRLVEAAIERQPDVIICVDYGGFNLRFQARIRKHLRQSASPFNNWRPKLVQFVSPQVWGSRPGRAIAMERNLDLLISILPFERAWFAQQTPGLKVVFVGHPLVGRHAGANGRPPQTFPSHDAPPVIALLPGSRRGELQQHLPVMLDAARRIRRERNCEFKLVVPTEDLAVIARTASGDVPVEVVVGDLSAILRGASLAISKTGTITLELALFGVPAITLYKTSALTYWIARQLVTVKWLSMPNLLAGSAVYPEFVQHVATGETIAGAALALLNDPAVMNGQREALQSVVDQLGEPGAPDRAALEILKLFEPEAERMEN